MLITVLLIAPDETLLRLDASTLLILGPKQGEMRPD